MIASDPLAPEQARKQEQQPGAASSPSKPASFKASLPDPSAPHLQALNDASRSLRNLLGVIIAVERRFGNHQSPLELLRQVTGSPDWQWLKPLYQMIADVDHAAHEGNLKEMEVSAIRGHALGLLFGRGANIEQDFLDHYRKLLQTDPEVAIAHGAALQALQKLPEESDDEAERLHARHQWTLRCKRRRETQSL